MKKLLLLSVLSIFMIACHQPDTPPYSYSMNIDDLQESWLERPIVMLGREGHRYLSLPITFNEEKDRYNVKIEFYCPEIFKDDKYHTINIVYSIVKGKYLYNLESFTLDSYAGEIENQGENNAPIIVFSINTAEKKSKQGLIKNKATE